MCVYGKSVAIEESGDITVTTEHSDIIWTVMVSQHGVLIFGECIIATKNSAGPVTTDGTLLINEADITVTSFVRSEETGMSLIVSVPDGCTVQIFEKEG